MISLLPVFVLALDQGTAFLSHFKALLELYKGNPLSVPVILTKLHNHHMNASNELKKSS